MRKKVLKIFVILFSIFLVFLVGIYILTRTQIFHSFVRSSIVSYSEKNMNAKLKIGNVGGDLITGIVAQDISIKNNNENILFIKNAIIKYDLYELITGKNVLHRITLDSMKLFLKRTENKTFNFQNIFKETGDSAKFTFRRIIVTNGEVEFIDETTKIKRKLVNISSDIKVDLIYLKSEMFVNSFEFTDDKTKIKSKLENTGLYFSENEIIVNNLDFETNKSRIYANVKISDLKTDPIFKIDLKDSKINFEEAAKLSNSKIPFEESVLFAGNIYGNMNKLSIKNFKVEYANSKLNLEAELKNSSEFKIISYNSIILPIDFALLTPSKKEYLKEVKSIVLNGVINKTKLNADFNLLLTNENQEIKVDGSIPVSSNKEELLLNVTVKNLNISDLLGSKYSRSQLNFAAKIEGKDETINYSVNVAPSHYNFIKIDEGNLNGVLEKNIFSGSYSHAAEAGKLELQYYFNTNKLGLTDTSLLISGNFEKVNLANIMKDTVHNSLLNGKFNLIAQGEGVDNSIVNGDLTFNDSKYNKFYFDNSTVLLTFGKKNKLWEYNFRSRLADATFIGEFSPKLLQHAFLITYEELNNLFNSKKQEIYNSLGVNQIKENTNIETSEPKYNYTSPQNCKYKITINNLEPLTMLMELPQSSAEATIEGSLHVRGEKLFLSGTTNILTGRSTIENKNYYIDNFKLNYSISNIDLQNKKNVNQIDLYVETSANAIYLGDNKFENINFEFDLKNQKSRFLAAATINKEFSTEIQGGILFTENSTFATINSLFLRLNEIQLNNNKPIKINISQNGVSIPKFSLYESSNESVINKENFISLFGDVKKDGRLSCEVQSKQLNIFPIAKILGGEKHISELTASSLLQIEGTLTEPVINSNIELFWKSSFDNSTNKFFGNINYLNKFAMLDLKYQNSLSKNLNLSLNGKIPVNINLLKLATTTDDQIKLDISINNLNAKYLEFLFSSFNNLNGSVSGSLTLEGKFDKPELNGKVKLENLNYIYSPNGLKYLVKGDLLFEKDNMKLSNFTLKNETSEYSKGNTIISGNVNFSKLTEPNYNVNLNGELKIMKQGNTSLSDYYYGELVLATTNVGLNFTGSGGVSKVSGKLLTRFANLIVPPAQTGPIYRQSKISSVVVIDDTSKQIKQSDALQEMITFLQERESRLQKTSPLDEFDYDLQFQTDGIVSTRFIFNPATNEELIAYLDGSFSMRNTNKINEMYGTINITPRSTYTFYKQFSASGNLEFKGDGSNPTLNIIALYTGTRLKPEEESTPQTEDVHVQLEIKGTKLQLIPKLSLYQLNDKKDRIERTTDVEGDVISFLLTSSPGIPGKFREDLNLNDKKGISEVLGNTVSVSMLNSFTNTLLSGMMMDFVRANNITFISSAELRYSTDTPDLRLGGEVLDAYWSFGGKVFSDINNANLSLQMPLSSLTGSRKYKNFVFEVERKIEPIEYNIERQSIFGARVYYKIIF